MAPHNALHVAERIVHELSEGGATFQRVARWLDPHVNPRSALHAAVAAWVDGLSTAVEGFLLYQGSVWGEWIVVFVLGALVPFEALSLEHHPSPMRLVVLIINALIVVYLVVDRLRRAPHPRAPGKAPPSAW